MGVIPSSPQPPRINGEIFRHDKEHKEDIEEILNKVAEFTIKRQIRDFRFSTSVWIGLEGKNIAISVGHIDSALHKRGDFYEHTTADGQKIYIDQLLLKKKYQVN